MGLPAWKRPGLRAGGGFGGGVRPMPFTNMDPNLTNQLITNLMSAFIPMMNNSVKLTGEITATLVQPSNLYNTAINAGAIVISGIMGGIMALIGVKETQKHSDEREERNRTKADRRLSREERKKAYLNLITLLRVMEWETKIAKDKQTPFSIPLKEIMLTLNEFKLFASADLNYIFYISNVDGLSEESNNAFMDKAIPAMARELQDEDVYAVFNEKLKADAAKR